MRTRTMAVACGLVLLGMGSLAGCGRDRSAESGKGETAAANGGHRHDHGDEGPHGGHIIEIGSNIYHAELTHSEDGHVVGVYILGADAKRPEPIDAASVTINVRAAGEPTEYELQAVPQPGDPAGQASYFELSSEPLHAVVSGEAASAKPVARLSLNIGDKKYVGLVDTAEHHHDHDHGHEH